MILSKEKDDFVQNYFTRKFFLMKIQKTRFQDLALRWTDTPEFNVQCTFIDV